MIPEKNIKNNPALKIVIFHDLFSYIMNFIFFRLTKFLSQAMMPKMDFIFEGRTQHAGHPVTP